MNQKARIKIIFTSLLYINKVDFIDNSENKKNISIFSIY